MKRIFELYRQDGEGYIELYYNEKEHLIGWFFEHSKLENMSQFVILFGTLPNTIDALIKYAGETKRKLIEKDFIIPFENFWKAYNKKINKKRTEGLWNRISQKEKIEAFNGIKNYDRYLGINTWRTKKDPSTYLSERSWEDELR